MSRDAKVLAAYLATGIFSVALAFAVSVQWMGRSSAQEGGSAESAPGDSPSESGLPSAADLEQLGQAPPNSAQSDLQEIEGFLQPYIYDTNNRRDPFEVYPDFVPSYTPTDPNQGLGLDQMRLVGIMWDIKKPKAMFQLPTNEIRVFGRDESIGNRDGYIAAIREGEVVVVESSNRKGETVYRTRVLRIER